MYNYSAVAQHRTAPSVYKFHFYVCSTLILPGTQQAWLFTQQLTPYGSIYDSRLPAPQNCSFVSVKNVSFLTSFSFLENRGIEREGWVHE